MTTLWFESALLPAGWADRVRVTVDAGGLVSGVEAGVDPQPADVRHACAVPGLANLHSHAFQRAMAGLTETRGPSSDNFWTWREWMYRFLDRLTPDDVRIIAAQAYAEMLESGFTRVGEFHYLHHAPDGSAYGAPAEMAAAIAAAAEETGAALTLLPVFYAHATFGGAPPLPGQRRFICDVDGFANLMDASAAIAGRLPDGRIGVAPHSLRAVTPDELTAVAAMTAGPVHMHAAEQVKEVDDCVAWSGRRPVEWLLDRGLDARWCLIHATHLTAEETTGLARSGAVAGLCPITEANLGDGVFPAADYLTSGGAFGVGTDSNVVIDAAEELRALEYAQRLTQRARNVLADREGASTGAVLFRGALAGGAQALADPAAAIAAGRPADLVALDLDHPSLVGRRGDALLDAWIFGAGARSVEAVWRRGRQVVASGRHVRSAEIATAYREVLRKLLA
ncbi:MAG: formimidoylglutamate deiminase [Phenylobacterium sp.]|uniref:formimidoylglutamate deiminase n=1 Tax=Phenylobacterium sp. TaxID=1871053 RepID=UPI001A4B595B|nr:formimidoylglutamate deiminase [Phenylobacterium sp.]MBL8554013.1 formimidoylglutamate deiminase [Phenylobacterium sp.]